MGGYSDSIIVKERFVLRVPSNLNLSGAAPLLCAGITTYSPMRHWGVTKGKKVGDVVTYTADLVTKTATFVDETSGQSVSGESIYANVATTRS